MFSLYIGVDITLLLLYWVVQDLAMSNMSLVRAFVLSTIRTALLYVINLIYYLFMKKLFSLIVLCSLLFSSCSTIFCGSKAKVTFDSDINEEAIVTIDGKKHKNVTFPFTTKIKRGFDETIVKVEAPSYETETLIVDKKFNPVSVINLLDILSWAIDAATGAITKPEQKFYQIEMTPKADISEVVK